MDDFANNAMRDIAVQYAAHSAEIQAVTNRACERSRYGRRLAIAASQPYGRAVSTTPAWEQRACSAATADTP